MGRVRFANRGQGGRLRNRTDHAKMDGMCKRVKDALSTELPMIQVRQLALACRLCNPYDVIGYLFDEKMARLLLQTDQREAVKLTLDEWYTTCVHSVERNISPETASALNSACMESITNALRCTIPNSILEHWDNKTKRGMYIRALCYYAVHCKDSEQLLQSIFGTLVTSDSRRLEELQFTIEEKGLEIIDLGSVIVTLSQTPPLW